MTLTLTPKPKPTLYAPQVTIEQSERTAHVTGNVRIGKLSMVDLAGHLTLGIGTNPSPNPSP